jgi:hypothetical protein
MCHVEDGSDSIRLGVEFACSTELEKIPERERHFVFVGSLRDCVLRRFVKLVVGKFAQISGSAIVISFIVEVAIIVMGGNEAIMVLSSFAIINGFAAAEAPHEAINSCLHNQILLVGCFRGGKRRSVFM